MATVSASLKQMESRGNSADDLKCVGCAEYLDCQETFHCEKGHLLCANCFDSQRVAANCRECKRCVHQGETHFTVQSTESKEDSKEAKFLSNLKNEPSSLSP